MKRKILLNESDLTKLIKKIIYESNDLNSYKTMNKHILYDNINKIYYRINPGDLWLRKSTGNEIYYEHEKTKPKLYFTCNGNTIAQFEEDELYKPRNINMMKGETKDVLISTMKNKLC